MHVCMWVGAYVDKGHVDRDRDRGECGDRDRSRVEWWRDRDGD